MDEKAKRLLWLKIHREGLKIIGFSGLFLLLVNFLFRYFAPEWFWINLALGIASLILWAIIIYFFRVPSRDSFCEHGQIS